MTSISIQKAAKAAYNILKGDGSSLTSTEMEAALMAFADGQARDGETSAQAFVRLLSDNDPTADALAKALDALRTAEQQAHSPELRDAVVKRAEGELDQFVKHHQRSGEDTPHAYARLANDNGFLAVYERLTKARNGLH